MPIIACSRFVQVRRHGAKTPHVILGNYRVGKQIETVNSHVTPEFAPERPFDDSLFMTPDNRLVAIAKTLAAGILRLQTLAECQLQDRRKWTGCDSRRPSDASSATTEDTVPDGETSSVALFPGFGHCQISWACSFCFRSPNPTPVGCDRLGESNPSITQASRDRETAESLGEKRGREVPPV